MAPEQAGGEVDRLDERCDVFGLGAVLCEVLTGVPPYTGRDADQIFRRAMAANQVAVHARLDACGAEPELVALCRRCLAPEPDDRPRDAGEVAAAVAALTRAVLPGMRKRRSGHIINIASICGLAAIPSLGDYCATKFAVEGLSECLALEAGPLGIRVTLVEPSSFRTKWAGGSAKDSSAREFADYDATAGAARRAARPRRQGTGRPRPRRERDHPGGRIAGAAAPPAPRQGRAAAGAREARRAARGLRRVGKGHGRGRLPDR
jgi:NAD(P)-dependent dehydrogenase (short-subunit alcohol dehydrogenase family)